MIAPLLLAGCLSHPPPPDAPYHALAADSGWNLVIDDQHVTFIPAGQQPIRQPRPPVISGVAGDIYQTPRIDVNIVHGPCLIGERAYPDSVQLRVDGRLHTGCGGVPETASAPEDGIRLADTRWRVALVNARPTPPVGDFSMRFEGDGDFSARLGCNSIGGQYRIDGRTLTTANVVSTQMGCPEPAASFEQQAGLIFARPMSIEIAEGGRLVLANSAGSLSLVPLA
ncbi:MAG TPA: META domain-containing protein [Sphingomicrobium sp.]|nr:META domain-containing protein [Sphingomicrobium sp.]